MAVTELSWFTEWDQEATCELLTTAIARYKLSGLRYDPVSDGIVPCICSEGLIRDRNGLTVCPECKGMRRLVVSSNQRKR